MHQNKEHANAIKDKAWYKRWFSSNVKDIGEVLFEQNTALATLYILIRLQSISSRANTQLLAELYNYADKEASATDKEKNVIKESIIAILEKNRTEFQRNAVRDKALMKLLKFAQNAEEESRNINKQIEELQNVYDNRYSSILAQLDEKVNKNEFVPIVETFAKKDQVYSTKEVDSKLKIIDKQKANITSVEFAFAQLEKKFKRAVIAFSIIIGVLFAGLITCFIV